MNRSSQVLEQTPVENLSKLNMKEVPSSFSISNELRSYSLSDLLPYDPKTKSGDRLIAGLKEYDFLLQSAENAVKLICKGQISCFDPLVGENACQIRALKNCLIFSANSSDGEALLGNIRAAKNKVTSLSHDLPTLAKGNLSLLDILESEGVDIKLTYKEMYLIQSYLLTVVKTIKPPKENLPFVKNEYTDTKKLKSLKSVGTSFAENLVKKLRESLSACSVSFVQEISAGIAPDLLHDALLDELYIRHNRLHCLPCYWVTQLLMVQALKSQIPLIIVARQLATDQTYNVIREVLLSFKPSTFGYKHSSLDIFLPNTPALVLLVNSCRKAHEFPETSVWKNELLQYNPIDLILAYAASHRQYPDASREELVDQIQDKQFSFYKKKAIEWGCSIENPTGFFLSHAFCERIESIPNHLSLQNESYSFTS